MRAPRWMVLSDGGLAEDGHGVLVNVRVRRWHPGFWLFAAQTAIRSLIGKPRYVSGVHRG